jgi:hypothetical protein
VTDNYTGLVWQQSYSTAQMTWSAAAGYCGTLGLNGHTWRLPGLNELTTLVDEARVGPAINPTAFPNTQFCNTGTLENYYWAREELPGSTFAWGINFCDGVHELQRGDRHVQHVPDRLRALRALSGAAHRTAHTIRLFPTSARARPVCPDTFADVPVRTSCTNS